MPEYYGELGNCINIQNLLEGCASPPHSPPPVRRWLLPRHVRHASSSHVTAARTYELRCCPSKRLRSVKRVPEEGASRALSSCLEEMFQTYDACCFVWACP